MLSQLVSCTGCSWLVEIRRSLSFILILKLIKNLPDISELSLSLPYSHFLKEVSCVKSRKIIVPSHIIGAFIEMPSIRSIYENLMVDGKRNFTKFEDATARLSNAQARLMDAESTFMRQQTAVQEDIRILTNLLHAMDSKLDQISNSLHSESSHHLAIHQIHLFIYPDNQQFHPPRSLKLDVPLFDGSDPLG